MNLTNINLMNEARKAAKNSYSPYSKISVGCAILTFDNSVIVGVNVENASYGLTVCAERNAIFNSIALGHRKIKKLAVIGLDSNGNELEQFLPCGACRQVMSEFMPPDSSISYISNSNLVVEVKLSDIFPVAFEFPQVK